MGTFLSAPITDKESELFEFACGTVGASAMQGWRKDMEDEHVIMAMPTLNDHIFLAVFDGHGGKGAAAYAEKHMITVIENTPEWKDYVETSTPRDPEALGKALIAAFHEIDVMMRTFQNTTQGQDYSGCTSVTCMITPNHFICANAGDSRCVLGTNNKTIPLSRDHKPDDPEERNRILNAGGKVTMKRVDGDLAVSRALGDFQFKARADLTASEQKVSCNPVITIVERTPQDDVLILACDGLWDVFSSEEVIQEIRTIFASGEQDMKLVAEEMLDLALAKGSRDNVSAVILRLSGAVVGPLTGGGVTARRAARLPPPDGQYNGGNGDNSHYDPNNQAIVAVGDDMNEDEDIPFRYNNEEGDEDDHHEGKDEDEDDDDEEDGMNEEEQEEMRQIILEKLYRDLQMRK